TGRASGFFGVVPVEPFEPPVEPVEPVEPPLFSGDLVGVGPAFGRLLDGLVDEFDDAGLSLGREVRNAPRTSSPSCSGSATARAAHMKTNPKRIALNRITKFSLYETHPGA
ncbi:MAG TPA: hypothetical protein VL907_07640, partial [Pyrinomonadaceae bacterium]|nr:hypothetical protein [Pyrinomonadaceae bacterium]